MHFPLGTGPVYRSSYHAVGEACLAGHDVPPRATHQLLWLYSGEKGRHFKKKKKKDGEGMVEGSKMS